MGTVLTVAQRGEAILTLQAAPVADTEFGGLWLSELAEAMQTTMLERNGVGIAAPQVYVSKRVVIIASRPNPRYPDAPEMSAIVMVNPVILNQSAETVLGEEGCLSVEGQRAQVERAYSVQVRYQDVKGLSHEIELKGFPARIVQHEIDHLDGILFVDRLNLKNGM